MDEDETRVEEGGETDGVGMEWVAMGKVCEAVEEIAILWGIILVERERGGGGSGSGRRKGGIRV